MYCPALVPVGRANVNESTLNHSRALRRRSYNLDVMSPSLMRANGRRVDANGGHVVVAWTWRGAEYQVSAHGDANEPRILAIARSVVDEQRR